MHNRIIIISSVYLFLTLAEGAWAQISKGPSDEVYEFIEKHLNGKVLTKDETTIRTGGGKLEAVTSSSVKYENLTRKPFGFYIDYKLSNKVTVFDIDSNGTRKGEGRIEDYSLTRRIQVSQRRSSGQLIGIDFPVDESGVLLDDGIHPFSASAVRISMAGDALLLESQSILHDDLFAEQGRYRPGFIESVYEYKLMNGKIARTSKTKGFDVDLKTSTKTLSDSLPPIISYER